MNFWAFLSNQITACLIDDKGDIVWWTVPRFDGFPVFAKLLDGERGGSLSLKVNPEKVVQEYIYPNVLQTVIKTMDGKVTINDVMPLGESSIIRQIETDFPVKINVSPTFNYGLYTPIEVEVRDGARFVNPLGDDCLAVVFFGQHKRTGRNEWIVKGKVKLYLNYSTGKELGVISKRIKIGSLDVDNSFDMTVSFWSKLTTGNRLIDASIGTIYGLIFRPSGSVIAAPTTSLPEVVGGKRNWDYRFVWVRDASIIAEALLQIGEIPQARRILSFLFGVINFSAKPFFHPLYSVDGGEPPPEKEIAWLTGYKNSQPVRVGNAASTQVQLDIEGFFVWSVRKLYEITQDKVYMWEYTDQLEHIADWVSNFWELKDASLWEERGEPKHYTHSKAMMWIALDSSGRILDSLGIRDRWGEARTKIREWILSNCVYDGYLVRYPGSKEVDIALAMLPLYGFIDVRDPIFIKTLHKIEEDLVVDGFVKRYRKDFMGEAKHPFTLGSGVLARIYLRLGELSKAEKLLSNLIRASGSLGLIGEHYDTENKLFTGNFPQGFSHAELLMALKEYEAIAGKQAVLKLASGDNSN